MKKTVLASTLAVGLGVTGFAAGNSADAAEQGIDKAELANLAQSNPEQLNASPVQEGSYSYNFNYNGLNYNFESNGQTWSWSYGEVSSGSSVNVNSHLQAIAQRESGGDLKAVNPSSGAAGKYQFLQSTWDSVAPAQYKGVSPTEAPESVQDAAAVKLYNEVGASQWVTA